MQTLESIEISKDSLPLPFTGSSVPGVASSCLQDMISPYHMVKIRVFSSLGWRYFNLEDWWGRWLLPSPPVIFGQFFHKVITRRFFLSISLPEQAAPRSLLSSFQTYRCWISCHFSPVMVSFYYHWLPNSSYVGKQEKYFCVLTLFSSNTYMGEEGRFLAHFWDQS